MWSRMRWRRRLSGVFAASLLLNLFAFLVGQIAALSYLRSGRTWLGLTGIVASWLLLDGWLVARFIYAASPDELRLLAASLQLVSALLVGSLAWALWRRRWSTAAGKRTERFAVGMAQYLRSEYPAARATFTGLVRTDPWDTAAWIALGDVLAHSGQGKRARGCYRRARAVDVQRAFSDVLQYCRDRRVS
jgi:hypothetical protein